MAYNKVNIRKSGDGAGCATPKYAEIIVIDVADIKAEPTRTVGDPTMVGDFELNTGAKALTIYATPSSIEMLEEASGEADARGVKLGVAFEHPGNSVHIKAFVEAYMNKGVVFMVKEGCGSAAPRTQVIGSVCNPLYMSFENTNNKEATKRKFTFKQELADPFLAGEYTGTEVPIVETTQEEGA